MAPHDWTPSSVPSVGFVDMIFESFGPMALALSRPLDFPGSWHDWTPSSGLFRQGFSDLRYLFESFRAIGS